ncbi:triosephosphate isomerase (TIM) [Nematocida sp. AWRm77]|nr:triosephosphate isomerase (TIM) [Nematocida sp. AWRm77]
MICVGNWKMNGSKELAESLGKMFGERAFTQTRVVVLPPHTHIQACVEGFKGTGVVVGAQSICPRGEKGAYTGEVSAGLVKDVGGRVLLAGHSERRELFGEGMKDTLKQVSMGVASSMDVIVCLGETEAERKEGKTEEMIGAFMEAFNAFLSSEEHARPGLSVHDRLTLAYEPVWAIGTSVTPTPKEVQEAIQAIKSRLASPSIKVIYGGSVTKKNAQSLLETRVLDGFLVGGASLSSEFVEICHVCEEYAGKVSGKRVG